MATERPLGAGRDRPASDLLELLVAGDPPAFATDNEGRISFWNRGAERLFGRATEDVLGRPCHEVVRGRDAFGNRYCNEECPVLATLRGGESVTGCEIAAETRPHERKTLDVTLLRIPGRRGSTAALVHILRPVDDVQIQRMLQRLGEARAGGAPALPPLTEREREILGWVAAGLQNKEVAQRLDISPATVRNHVHNILEKLEVHSKLEAVSLAYRSGWVTAGAEDAAPASDGENGGTRW